MRADEPLWQQDDTDLAVALTDIEEDRCSGCGHPRSVSMDPAHEFHWRAERLVCHACAARDRAARRDDGKHRDDAGMNWIVRRTDG